MKQHALSAAFPAMPAADYSALVADIKEYGQHYPIVVFEGAVLDGWHRYRACEEIGVKVDAEEYGGNDPVAFVKSANWNRRHLTESQRAAAIVKLREWRPSGLNKRSSAPGAEDAPTAAELAKEAGVATRTIERAKKVEAKGSEALKEAVKEGKVSVKVAEKIAAQPAKDQPKALAEALKPKDKAKPKDKPKAKPAAKATPILSPEYEALLEKYNELKEANQILIAELDTLVAYRDTDGVQEMKNLREELRVAKRRIDGLMTEKNELIKTVKWHQRKAA